MVRPSSASAPSASPRRSHRLKSVARQRPVVTVPRTEPRAVVHGGAAGSVYLLVLLLVPGLERVRIAGVLLVLASGLVAGATAGLAADDGPRPGAWHGLLAGSLAGGATAGLVAYTFTTPGAARGVFYGLNYLVATSAGTFPVIARHGVLVVAGGAGIGWGVIAALGLYAGHRAPLRDSHSVIETE